MRDSRRNGRWGTLASVAGFILANAPCAWSQELEEIVVTAQKREQSAQDVPITITSLTGQELARNGVKDLFQAADFVPGMVFSRAPDDGLGLTFRGVGTPARSQAFEQSVAVFLDGMFIAKGRMYSLAFFDVDRMEMIKGTQSTLLGKNTSLGAISLVSKLPGKRLTAEGQVDAELVHPGYTADGALNVPVSSTFALRLAGHYSDTNGWVKNTATGRWVPKDKDSGIRLTAKYDPTDDFSGILSYQYSDSKRLGVAYQIVDPSLPPQFGEGVLNNTESEFTSRTPSGETEHDTRSNAANLRLTWTKNGYSVVSQSAYIDYTLANDDDFDFASQPWTDFIRHEKYSQVTEELRLASPTHVPVEYLAGAFFLHSNWHSVENQLWGVPGFPPGTPIAGQLFNGPFTNDFQQKSDAISGFGSVTWHVSDNWRVTGGLRYTSEKKDVVYGRFNAAPFTIWNTAANPPFPLTPLAFSDSFLDGNANFQYDMSSSTMLYVAYGHGTKTGGYVETNTVASANPAKDAFLASEHTQTVEGGFKSTVFDKRLRLNASIFYTRIENFQDTTFTGTAFITENLPLKTKGLEFETLWQVTKDLRLGLSGTYANAQETPTPLDVSLGVKCNPCRPAQAPRWNGTFDAHYIHRLTPALNWTGDLHARYRGYMYNQRGELFPSETYSPVDLTLGIENSEGTWGVSVQGRNLNNSLSADFSSPSVAPYFAGLAGPAPLRSVGLKAWYRQ